MHLSSSSFSLRRSFAHRFHLFCWFDCCCCCCCCLPYQNFRLVLPLSSTLFILLFSLNFRLIWSIELTLLKDVALNWVKMYLQYYLMHRQGSKSERKRMENEYEPYGLHLQWIRTLAQIDSFAKQLIFYRFRFSIAAKSNFLIVMMMTMRKKAHSNALNCRRHDCGKAEEEEESRGRRRREE